MENKFDKKKEISVKLPNFVKQILEKTGQDGDKQDRSSGRVGFSKFLEWGENVSIDRKFFLKSIPLFVSSLRSFSKENNESNENFKKIQELIRQINIIIKKLEKEDLSFLNTMTESFKTLVFPLSEAEKEIYSKRSLMMFYNDENLNLIDSYSKDGPENASEVDYVSYVLKFDESGGYNFLIHLVVQQDESLYKISEEGYPGKIAEVLERDNELFLKVKKSLEDILKILEE